MGEVKEKGIIFNYEMVRAILDGRKTQTRRVMKVQPVKNGGFYEVYGAGWSEGVKIVPAVYGHSLSNNCPFGAVGDHLWVRETFQGPLFDAEYMDAYLRDSEAFEKPEYCQYAADGGPRPEYFDADDNLRYGWRSSTSMPRWASRITLEITGVRVERLHVITLGDICKEFGCCVYDFRPATYGFQAFEELWESIYGTDSWKANPWVWVIEFKVIEIKGK